MNILIVHNRYQIPGGEDTVFENEAALLRKHGHHVVLYERTNKELDDMNVFQKTAVPLSMIFSVRSYIEIRDIIRKEHIDVVHVHNTLLRISPSVYYVAVKERVPAVQTIHNFRMICPNGICYRDGHICEECVEHGLRCAIRHNCYRSNKLQTLACVLSMYIHRLTGIYRKLHYICLTEFNKHQLLKQRQISESQISVKPNSMNSDGMIKPFEERKNQIIYAGRLDESKGIRFLLKVWKEMKSHPYKLLIYGSGPLEEECSAFIKSEGLVDVELCGSIAHDQLMNIIGESKALILPTQWYEGFPMSMLEAMSKGTPVIVPDLGNAGSITVNHVTGYKYQPGSVEDCIRAINEDMNINDAVYKHFIDNYSEEKNYESLMDIYETVTGESHE